jgi:hypothetical protein
MANGKWQMANGRWQMADGKWQTLLRQKHFGGQVAEGGIGNFRVQILKGERGAIKITIKKPMTEAEEEAEEEAEAYGD